MTRPSPSQARALILGIAIPIAVALMTSAFKEFTSSKLDVARFERDSINRDYKLRALEGVVWRIDSTTRRTDARLDQIRFQGR